MNFIDFLPCSPGRRHYMQHLHDLYKQSDVSWFTPVELFKVGLVMP